MKTRTALAMFAAAGFALSQSAQAVVTARWVVQSYKDWDAGDGENTLITSEGHIKPGWTTSRTDLEVEAAWAAVRAPDGGAIIGTDGGAILRVTGDKASKLVEIEGAVAVVSLAFGPGGELYAGTMPRGEVWRVDVKAGKASKLVALEGAETVWSLAASGGSLYAGTGPEGKLFQIDPKSGKAKLAFATEDKRVMSLAATGDGAVWLGTSEKALVFRYDPKAGTARAMADFEGNEITALVPARGGVVAAANDFAEPTGTGPRTRDAATKDTDEEKKKTPGQKPKAPKVGETPGADKDEPTTAKLPRPGERKGKGAVYRIEGDGRLEQLHALTATYVAALASGPDGRVFVGAGDKGRVYLIDSDDSVSTAFDVDERLVSQVLADETGIAFSTADGAAYYRASGAASKAVYTSKVSDASASARYGRIVWHGSGDVKIETRTGNTAEPGIGWSGWAAPRGVSAGGGESRGGTVTSPPGRYLQFRVTFGEGDAMLRAATVYHLPQNRATAITDIEVTDDTKGTITNKNGLKPRSPVLKVTWKVENDDKDETVYYIDVRREGEVTWRRLVTKDGKPLSKAEHEWNTETFPDGYYQLRVTASDHLANASDRAIRSDRITPLLLVDNNKPALSGISVKYPAVSVRATDSMSAISEAAYAVDDGPWQLAATDDALYDSLSEILVFRLPAGLESGAHTLTIRVADEAGNIGSESVTFRVR